MQKAGLPLSAGSFSESQDDALQIAIIDFGQAVHVSHPSADELLLRDVNRISFFFKEHGIRVLAENDAYNYVLAEIERDNHVPTSLESDEGNELEWSPENHSNSEDIGTDAVSIAARRETRTVVNAGNESNQTVNVHRVDDIKTLLASPFLNEVTKHQGARWRRASEHWDDLKEFHHLEGIVRNL